MSEGFQWSKQSLLGCTPLRARRSGARGGFRDVLLDFVPQMLRPRVRRSTLRTLSESPLARCACRGNKQRQEGATEARALPVGSDRLREHVLRVRTNHLEKLVHGGPMCTHWNWPRSIRPKRDLMLVRLVRSRAVS